MNQQITTTNTFTTLDGFELIQRISKAFSSSTLVPKLYQATPDNPAALGNCIIALNIAERINADPMMVMQNLNIVSGRPCWSAKFLIACINASGRFSPLRFTWQGKPGNDDFGCRAIANEISSGEVLEGPLITIKLAKDEGWLTRNGSKWKNMPEKMMMYRSGAWFCDVYCPELSVGLRTEEEVVDAYDPKQSVDSSVIIEQPEQIEKTQLDAINTSKNMDELQAIKPKNKVEKLAFKARFDLFNAQVQTDDKTVENDDEWS